LRQRFARAIDVEVEHRILTSQPSLSQNVLRSDESEHTALV
jgi:hypothetical protein